MAGELVMRERMQGVDCYWCEDGTPHRHEPPEPEAAGVVDVAMIRAALEEAATNPDRGIGGSQYAVLGHYTLPQVLAALERSTARAERLEAALRLVQWGDVRWIEPADHTKGVGEWCPWCQIEKNAGHARNCIVRAALAGDAPGRGEEG